MPKLQSISSTTVLDASVKPAGRFDSLCEVLFELGWLLALLTFALMAIHGQFVHHVNISRVIDGNHVAVPLTNPSDLKVGQTYSIFRFSADWQEEIGKANVASIHDGEAILVYDPSRFRWKMGRQGQVTQSSGSNCVVNLGSDHGLITGSVLNLFEGRSMVGSIRLAEVQPDRSTGSLLSYKERGVVPKSMRGYTVSEYTVVTQLASFDQPFLTMIEVAAYFIVLVVYPLLRIKYKRSPFLIFGPRLARMVCIPNNLKLAFHGLIGIPVIWFLCQFVIGSLAYLAFMVNLQVIHSDLPVFLQYETLKGLQLPLFALGLFVYEGALLNKRISPFALILEKLAFKGGVFGHEARTKAEHVTIWLLQLVIAYAFGRTLGGFLLENFNQGIAASWPSAPKVLVQGVTTLSLESAQRTFNALSYALTHAPAPLNEDATYLTVQTFIYNACILGGILGYGYSLTCFLWGKRIRNLDFTVSGWIVNAVCYGPLFGTVLWQMVPPTVGTDPIITSSPLRTLILLVSVYLNVVYTMSIWNLGTMFGVMTDKGVRTTGFYSVVRHPSYTMEPLMFVLTFSRGLTTSAQWFTAACFLLMYWLRSERDDQFMGVSNPDYVSYRAKTPYKFIPGIY